MACVYGPQVCRHEHLSTYVWYGGGDHVWWSVPGKGRGWRSRDGGSVAGQPALAFDSTGCERAVLGMSPPLRPPINFPQRGQSICSLRLEAMSLSQGTAVDREAHLIS